MLKAFEKLRRSLSKTKDAIFGQISRVVGGRKIDDELLEEIEEILISSDVGVAASLDLIERLRSRVKSDRLSDGDEVIAALKEEIRGLLSPTSTSDDTPESKPVVWLITGVNGVGKTTTIGKLATHFAGTGESVMIGACDTFRAAAIDQVAIWAERSGVAIIRAQDGADPAAVAYDAAGAARARSVDRLLIDTAGRLHTKSNLMAELAKIRRSIEKAAPEATIKSLLILDGTTGQNALQQVNVFTEAVGCDGLIVTKLDGTAKGGIVIAIAKELGVPVLFLGTGEGIDDLVPFDPIAFVDALFTQQEEPV